MQCLLWGPSAWPFAEGLSEAVSTSWAFAKGGPGTSSVQQARQLFGQADAIITATLPAAHDQAPKLKLVQVPGAGYDGIDTASFSKDVALCNVFEHEAGVSEYAVLAMLEWSHRLGAADRDMRRGDWSRSSRYQGQPDSEIAGKTLVIVGLGRIGRAVAKRASAFDMRIIAVNRTVRPAGDGIEKVLGMDRLADALRLADFVVLGCALTSETTGLINAAALGVMKPEAVIINVARGPVIDEAALWSALSERRIGGAVIDTWWQYPATATSGVSGRPFHTLQNVMVTPHIAGWTRGTVHRRTVFMAQNLDRLARGDALQNQIMRP